MSTPPNDAAPTHPAYGMLREITPFASVLLCDNSG